MNTSLLIVTFARDFPYLRHCLRSIQKHASGFFELVLAVPPADAPAAGALLAEISPGLPWRLVVEEEWPENGMLFHEWQIMRGDLLCPESTFIAHLDADCIFRAPVTPQTYIVEGRPVLRWEEFDSVATREPGVLKWREVTLRCLPLKKLKETMRCMPLVYHRETYGLARALIEQKTGREAGEYIRSCEGKFPQGFCEFVTLGNVAMKKQPEKYHLVEQQGDRANPPNHVIQFWSHGAPDLFQDVWIDGKQQRVIPINLIREVLGPEPGGETAQPSTGLRVMPDILRELKDRMELPEWLNRHSLTGAGAEIGVMHGGFAEHVLKAWKGERYYMVDLWARQSAEVYREKTDDIDYEAKYRDCVAIAGRFPIVKIIRKLSVEAAAEIPDGSLDWVFIDANHSYRAVLEDMDAWWPKLKSGGLLSGHDYNHDTKWPHFIEVKPAVDRWTSERNLPLHTDKDSWYVIKP